VTGQVPGQDPDVGSARDPKELRRVARFIRRRADRERVRAEQAWAAAALELHPERAAGLRSQAKGHADAETFYRQQATRFQARADRRDRPVRARPHLMLIPGGQARVR
jgi:hypothetical protein